MSSVRWATSVFAERFGGRPAVAVSAPGRVNLIGEHTDYNGGPVLPLAIERRAAVVAAPGDDWHLVSTVDGQVRRVDINGPLAGNWTDYLVGVARELRAIGAAPRGARAAVASAVPVGAGLASSAALTVAAAKALSLMAGRRLSAGELIDVAFRAEHDWVGVRCGRMDQTIAVLAQAGSAILLETATGSVARVPCSGRVWIVETGVSHRLSDGLLNQRRSECEEGLAWCRRWRPGLAHLAQLRSDDLAGLVRRLPSPLDRRVRHVVTESARARNAAAALAAGDRARAGRLLQAGHDSLRVDFESSVPEADFIVTSAVEQGAYGARLSGAGWGGAVVVLAPPAEEARILAEVARAFSDRWGRVPEMWSTRASAGAKREAIPAAAG